MANDFYNAEELASVALALIGPDLGAAATISRSFEGSFDGKIGYSVNVRKPSTLKARTRTLGATSAITADSISEDVVAVQLTDEIYSAVDVTDAEMTLKIEDFGRQVLKPQTDAIVYDVDDLVVTELEAITPTIDPGTSWTAANVLAPFASARKTLRANGVPVENLHATVGVDVYAALLEALSLQVAGSAAALRDGDAGLKLSGFTVHESNRIQSDRAVFYHRDAFHLAVRAPMVPRGVANGASISAGGFAVRSIMDYDSSTLQDRSVLSTFVGCQTLGVVKRAEDGTSSVYVPAVAADLGA